MKKIFPQAIFCVSALFCLTCGSVALKWNTPAPFGGELANGVQWKVDGTKISLVSKSGIEFLSFSQTKSFIKAGISKAEVKYKMASFKFKDNEESLCEEQNLDSISAEGGKLILVGSVQGGGRCYANYTLTLLPSKPDELKMTLKFDNKSLNRVWFTYGSDSEEEFYGFGEQFSHANLKGKTPFLFTEEQGIGRGDQPITTGANLVAGAGGNEYTTYAPIPHYITSQGRSIFFENSGYSSFDLSSSDSVTAHFWEFQEEPKLDQSLVATVWVSKDPKELVKVYTAKTGRYPVLPDWAYGTWLGVQGGTAKVKEVIAEAKKAGNPVTALWIQDWCGRRTTNFGSQLKWRWYSDDSLYPNFKQFVAELNKENVQVLGYINSFLADRDPKLKDDDFTNPMLEEAKKKGFLVKDKNGENYLIQTVGFPAYLIDLTNPDAVKWTKEIIKKNMIDMGLTGWMADFGEWLPYDAVLHSGISAKVYHNQYPVDWAKINRDAIKEAGKEGKIVFFTRAGYSYSSQHSTLFWAGDQMVSWGTHDGLPSAIIGMTSSGISGIALNHSDVGGYTTINNPIRNYHREKELLLRWAEKSAFTPVYRTHEGNRPEKNWQIYQYKNKDGVSSKSDPETVALFARIGRIHYALKDYFKILALEAKDSGLPIVRHPFLVEPNDVELRQLKYQFFVGDDLWVAPVIERGDREQKVRLPQGTWFHPWTKMTFSGGTSVKVNAPIGEPPVFIRVGGKNEALLRKSLTDL